MEAIEQIGIFTGPVYYTRKIDPLAQMEAELSAALSIYWRTASRILRASGINLLDPPMGIFLRRKIFSQRCFCIPITGPVYPGRDGLLTPL